MAELGDAADSKSAVLKRAWGFNSPSRHSPPEGGAPPSLHSLFKQNENFVETSNPPRVVIIHTQQIYSNALTPKCVRRCSNSPSRHILADSLWQMLKIYFFQKIRANEMILRTPTLVEMILRVSM